MLNVVILIGRMTADPELRYTANGNATCTFTIAVDRGFKSQDGEKQTDFLNVVCWRQLAENVAQYTGKGSLVAVEGRLQARTYENQEGQKRKVVEVVANTVKFLDKKKDKPSQGDEWDGVGKEVTGSMEDDSIPF
jgi:single-strand DNA-binding protein